MKMFDTCLTSIDGVSVFDKYRWSIGIRYVSIRKYPHLIGLINIVTLFFMTYIKGSL
uniref:Uncharacterized protein n=1 Tax=Arundo donax TaxID=35708 RepID=A0A0A9HUQ5_ARUDO